MPRLALIAAIPLSVALPLVRTARVLRHAWRHRDFRLACLRFLPAIAVAETCWSAGELTGYFTRRAGTAATVD
jgi:hypothetical protein